MGKKTRSSPTPTAPSPEPVDAGALSSLKEEANIAFAKKNYDGALEMWDRALKLVGADSPDAALLHSNKAACHMVNRRYKEAVSECNVALQLQPSFFKALVRRGKAYEGMGQLKNALSDLQKANRLDAATEDSKEAERRLRDKISGKKPAGLGSGLAARQRGTVPGTGRSGAETAASRQVAFPTKLSFGDDVRAIQLIPGVTYLELLEHARQVFPAAAPFVLKYQDRDGDMVTIASRNDIQRAMQEVVETATKSLGPRSQVTPGTLPAIRIQVQHVDSEDAVPKVPEEELVYMQQMLAQMQKTQAARSAAAAEAAAASGEAGGDAAQAPVQVDEWILSFVDLFKEYCGIDPDRPLEASEIGNEKLQAGFQAMLREDPKVDELLDAAMSKFEDQVCFGMYNQASVHQYRGEFAMHRAARAGEPAASIADEVNRHLDAAEAMFDRALAYKPAFLDGLLGKSGLAQVRAKLAAGYLLEPAHTRDDIADPTERATAEEADGKAAQARAFARVTRESALAADPFMERSYELVAEAQARMPEDEAARELRPMKPTAEQVPGDPESEVALKATMLINAGNACYEHSILRAAGGLEWRPLVERATAKFVEAGAHPTDIRNALKSHPLAEELQEFITTLPDPDAAKETEAAAAGEEEPKEQAKGLPALPGKAAKKKETVEA